MAAFLSVTVWVAGPAHAQSRGNLPEVGEVVFATGEAKVIPANVGANGQGEIKASKGVKIAVGDRLETASGGHIHIRFVDNAFASVRPGSHLQVHDYHFDAANPGQSRVKFSLVQGTSRFITGKAGQAAKQNFRLNTPISAIGVRGTDFVVQTTQDITRVAVYQGAIVASPFDANCSAQAFGPCSGALAKDLAGSLTNQYLEIKQASVPELIRPKNGAAGKVFVPANPNEPSAGKPTSSNGDASPIAAGSDRVGPSLQSQISSSSAFGSEPIIWGRWNSKDGLPEGYDLVAQQGGLALLRVSGAVNLPKEGKVAFELKSYESYRVLANGDLIEASVADPRLSIDFEKMRYSTKFNWIADQNSQTFSSRGSISTAGIFEPSKQSSNVELVGSLDRLGNEAAFLFSKTFANDGSRALGIINMKR